MNLKHFFVVVLVTSTGLLSAHSMAAPISIAGVQEPEEMRVEPFPTNKPDLSPPERLLGEALQNSDKGKPASLLSPLNRILEQYPDFSDGYIMRAFTLCEPGNDRAAIAADLDRALKSIASSRTGKKSTLALLSTKAKIDFANSDFAASMNDLEKAIRSDLEKATEFTNSGSAKPEKTASSVCIWTEPDVDELVRRYPADYRSHLFRGLYFSFFVNFSPEDSIVSGAIDSFNKAAQLNPRSALPPLFKAKLLGHMFVFNTRLNKLGWSDDARNKLDAELIGEFTNALAIDPNLLPALRGRALACFHLKQFEKAITDYDRILSFDPEDKTSYNDRGLAKTYIGREYDAISDFTSAIKLQPRDLLDQSHYSFEGRADAYVKTRQWDLALRDLTTAISLQIGSSLLLMNIDQFRAIYPEYNSVSNDEIARKLQQTFYPNWKYEDFAKGFFTHSAMSSTVIPDLYLKRSDTYLLKGNWPRASVDFRRAVNGFPAYADVIDRWREIGRTADARNYIDMKTFDSARNDSIKFWLKAGPNSGENEGPYKVSRFELNCRANQLRTLSFANYDAGGQIIGSGGGGRWVSIFPESIGEMLHNGACLR
jgi:tetratricopeptide (TPR) repeat protein